MRYDPLFFDCSVFDAAYVHQQRKRAEDAREAATIRCAAGVAHELLAANEIMRKMKKLIKMGVPTEYVEGEWVVYSSGMGESMASVWPDDADGWRWRALGRAGVAETYEAAREAALAECAHP